MEAPTQIHKIKIIQPSKENSLIYPDLLRKLLTEGVAETNSPKNRSLIYNYLRLHKIEFTTEIIGYLPLLKPNGNCGSFSIANGNAQMNYRYPGNQLGRVAKWIASRRMLAEDVEETCRRYNLDSKEEDIKSFGYNFELIRSAFTPGLTPRQIYAIIDIAWGKRLEYSKYNPFTFCPLRKPVVQFKLTSSDFNGRCFVLDCLCSKILELKAKV